MSPLEPMPAGARETARIGDWTIRATRIVRRDRRHPRSVCLLAPPPGFAGSARLGVIAANRRDEFSHDWGEGESVPLLFSIPVEDAERDTSVRADLLLEVSAATGAPANLTGRVAFTRTRETAHLYLAPLLGAETAGALREMTRRPAIRLALDASQLDRPLAEDARALIASGRLEIVDSGAGGAPGLPFPPRTRIGAPASLDRLPASVRAVLLIGEDAARWAASAHLPFRLVEADRSVLACAVPAPCAIDPRTHPDGASAAAVIDRLLLTLPHAGEAPRSAPGFCALPLASARDLRRLHEFVSRWNRGHATPALQLATPADYFAFVEELEMRGALFVPQAQLG
jgi:hypothetical protein